MAISLMALLVACSAGPRNYENDNDRLRRENLELTDQSAALQKRIEGLETSLAAAERGHQPAALPKGLHRPLCTRIEIDRFSTFLDQDKDGAIDHLRLYLKTFDQQGRFIPTVGSLKVSVVAAPPGKPAATLATANFDAATFDAAYHSGFGGTHYTLMVPMDKAPPEGLTALTISVELRDLVAGRTLQAQRIETILPEGE